MSQTKTALVTGANKGIGFAIAKGLGAEGYRVGVGSRDAGRGAHAVAQLADAGVDAFAVALDVADDASVAAAAEAVASEVGALDALVNNAGISGPVGPDGTQPATALDLDVVRAVLETNVLGVVRVTNAMLPLLRRAQAPRIVNVSSTVGSLALQSDGVVGPIMAAYAPTKTMLNAITVQYARELAGSGLLVNAVCPGLTGTDFLAFPVDRTPEQGAAIAVRLATVGADGPNGGFFDDGGVVPW